MKLIITGACGHIGSYLAERMYLIPKIKKTILIDSLESNRYCSLFNISNKNNLSFFQIDLSKKKSLDKFKDVDYLIHLASMTNAEKSFGKEKEMYKNNLDCMNNTVDFCKKNKIKLIHLSSTSVYGKQAELVDETCAKKYLKPQSPYAKIKLIEENILKKKKKIKYNTFRFGTIAGYSKGIRFHTAVNKFCLNAALNQDISVYKTALNQYRPYLSLRDAFKVFKFCIEKNFFKNDIFNALSGNFTVNDILEKIKKKKKTIKITLFLQVVRNIWFHILKIIQNGLIKIMEITLRKLLK